MIIYVYVRVVTYMHIIYMEHHCEQNWCKILNPVKGLAKCLSFKSNLIENTLIEQLSMMKD